MKTRIIVVIQGGLVQTVFASNDARVTVIDLDIEDDDRSLDDDELAAIIKAENLMEVY